MHSKSAISIPLKFLNKSTNLLAHKHCQIWNIYLWTTYKAENDHRVVNTNICKVSQKYIICKSQLMENKSGLYYLKMHWFLLYDILN